MLTTEQKKKLYEHAKAHQDVYKNKMIEITNVTDVENKKKLYAEAKREDNKYKDFMIALTKQLSEIDDDIKKILTGKSSESSLFLDALHLILAQGTACLEKAKTDTNAINTGLDWVAHRSKVMEFYGDGTNPNTIALSNYVKNSITTASCGITKEAQVFCNNISDKDIKALCK